MSDQEDNAAAIIFFVLHLPSREQIWEAMRRMEEIEALERMFHGGE